MRTFVWIAVVLIALAAGWRYRGAVTAWLTPEPPPKPIVFDNGTVRDMGDPASAPPAAAGLPAGALRKCTRGSETQYTNVACPPGFKEKPVSSDRVNVLPAGDAPAAKPAAAPPGERPRNVRDVLDPDAERLREKVIERATR